MIRILVFLLSTTHAFAAPPLTIANAPSATAGAGTAMPSQRAYPGKYSFGYLAETYVGADGPNNNYFDNLLSLQTLRANYNIGADQAVSALLNLTYNMINTYSGDEWGSGDFAIEYRHLQLQPGLDSYFRFYVPTSEYTAQVGMYQLQAAVQLRRTVMANLELLYAFNMRGYVYAKDQTGQRYLRAIPSVTLKHTGAKWLQPFVTIGDDSDWRYDSNGEHAMIVYNNGFALNASQRAHYDLNNDLGIIDVGSKFTLGKCVELNGFYEWYHFWHEPSRDALGDGAYELDISIESAALL